MKFDRHHTHCRDAYRWLSTLQQRYRSFHRFEWHRWNWAHLRDQADANALREWSVRLRRRLVRGLCLQELLR